MGNQDQEFRRVTIAVTLRVPTGADDAAIANGLKEAKGINWAVETTEIIKAETPNRGQVWQPISEEVHLKTATYTERLPLAGGSLYRTRAYVFAAPSCSVALAFVPHGKEPR